VKTTPKYSSGLRSGYRRPPLDQRLAGSRRAKFTTIDAADRRRIWQEEAVLFFFFALLVDHDSLESDPEC
jgi:hypothetical protein